MPTVQHCAVVLCCFIIPIIYSFFMYFPYLYLAYLLSTFVLYYAAQVNVGLTSHNTAAAPIV